jgi:hypothetical protein
MVLLVDCFSIEIATAFCYYSVVVVIVSSYFQSKAILVILCCPVVIGEIESIPFGLVLAAPHDLNEKRT